MKALKNKLWKELEMFEEKERMNPTAEMKMEVVVMVKETAKALYYLHKVCEMNKEHADMKEEQMPESKSIFSGK